jgi:hypothetical protein
MGSLSRQSRDRLLHSLLQHLSETASRWITYRSKSKGEKELPQVYPPFLPVFISSGENEEVPLPMYPTFNRFLFPFRNIVAGPY